MYEEEAEETLCQLRSYTIEVGKFFNIPPSSNNINHNGPFKSGQPSGAITHYTNSNSAITPSNPYGRLPTMLQRFLPGSASKVGVQFIVWDEPIARFEQIRKRYPMLNSMPGEVFYMGDMSYWHAGWANKWSYGIEIRNCGELSYDTKNKTYYWGKPGNKYIGRTPIKVQDKWYEPYTKSQMKATLWIHRLMSDLHEIRKERFLGHVHVTSTRLDPGLHFPLNDMRRYVFDDAVTPIDNIPFITAFSDDADFYKRTEIGPELLQAKDAILNSGLHRNSRDGVPDELDDNTQEFTAPLEDPRQSALKNAAWEKLSLLGYWPGESPNSPEFVESVRIFQARWKKKQSSANIQQFQADGKLTQATIDKMNEMIALVGFYC